MNISLKPVERLLFRSDIALLAEYRCCPNDPLFADSGPCNANSFVFPLTSTRIIREGAVLRETPNVVALYNTGVEYRSEVISPEGAHCAWMTLDAGTLNEIAEMPFRILQQPLSASLALRQRRLWYYAARYGDADALFVEGEAITLAEDVLGQRRHREKPGRRPLREIDAVREFLAVHFADPISLTQIATHVGLSPTYLSRLFRRTTGVAPHRFREELRLRRALDLLPDCPRDFSRLALELGYSSHSHFTNRFRQFYGLTPSEFVDSIRLGSAWGGGAYSGADMKGAHQHIVAHTPPLEE